MRQGLILLFLLLILSVAGGMAQTDDQQNQRPPQSIPPPRVSTGVQITNSGVNDDNGATVDREAIRAEEQAQQDAEDDKRRAEQEAMALRRLPPEPDIEFQDFVSSALGYRLQIYGHTCFRMRRQHLHRWTACRSRRIT